MSVWNHFLARSPKELHQSQDHKGKMKLLKEAKLAFLVILYFTFNTLFFFILKCFSVNKHKNYVQIFVLVVVCVFYVAAAAMVYRNSDAQLLTDDEVFTSVKPEVPALPFLDWYANLSPSVAFSLHDQETKKDVENIFHHGDDEFIPPLMFLECKNTGYDHEGYDHMDKVCTHDHAGLCDGTDHVVDENSSYDYQCGYEGDNEDNGDHEDDDLNKKIEEFIAAKRRQWMEEMIKERLLYVEAAKL